MRQRYDIGSIAKQLGVTKRTLQRKLKQNQVDKDDNGYIITDEILQKIGYDIHRQDSDNSATYAPGLHEQTDGTLIQVFTREEYDTFKRMLIEHKQLKQQVAQLQDWVERFTTYTNQRNTIEAHEKGVIDREHPVEDVQDLADQVQQKRQQIIEKMDKDKAKFGEWLKDL